MDQQEIKCGWCSGVTEEGRCTTCGYINFKPKIFKAEEEGGTVYVEKCILKNCVHKVDESTTHFCVFLETFSMTKEGLVVKCNPVDIGDVVE